MLELNKKPQVSSLLLVLAFMGCGPRDSGVYGELKENINPGAIAIALSAVSAQDPSLTSLFVAGPVGTTEVYACPAIAVNCNAQVQGAVAGVLAGPKDQRVLFRFGNPIRIDANQRLVVSTFAAGQMTAQQTYAFAIRGAGGTLPARAGWKIVLMASDQGNQGAWINAFDNARKKLKQLFMASGVDAAAIKEMSLHPDQQVNGVAPTSIQNLAASIQALAPQQNDACLVHMTSHGSRDGFNVGNTRLSPAQMEQVLAPCGNLPTVVLVSACFSGLYTLDQYGLKKPNRVIMTAADSERTSFGCGAENEYTYWDNCIIDNIPNTRTWTDFATAVRSCIVAKEGGQTSSNPQAFIGSQVSGLTLPGKQ